MKEKRLSSKLCTALVHLTRNIPNLILRRKKNQPKIIIITSTTIIIHTIDGQNRIKQKTTEKRNSRTNMITVIKLNTNTSNIGIIIMELTHILFTLVH